MVSRSNPAAPRCRDETIVTVRYVGYTRRAVIARMKQKRHNRKRTRSGRLYAQTWYVKAWLD
jgi:hypothetical protein